MTVAMPPTTEPTYEDQFTVFVDFLGFKEVSRNIDDTKRKEILELLEDLAALRGEFAVQKLDEESGISISFKPAISTFSDHIVISYPMRVIRDQHGSHESIPPIFIASHFVKLLGKIAAAALRIGFLVRGGSAIGKLYHACGVVFGEALLDAFEIESRTSVYPRVVLSQQITSRSDWISQTTYIKKCEDGLYHFDYFTSLLFDAAPVGEKFGVTTKEWFDNVAALIAQKLTELENGGRLNELAKWAWFAREFRSGLGRLPPQGLVDLGISLDAIPCATR